MQFDVLKVQSALQLKAPQVNPFDWHVAPPKSLVSHCSVPSFIPLPQEEQAVLPHCPQTILSGQVVGVVSQWSPQAAPQVGNAPQLKPVQSLAGLLHRPQVFASGQVAAQGVVVQIAGQSPQ